jgi:tRNA (guanine37-N1)-methyltransferase
MKVEILTIFPEMFGPFLDTGMVRIAREKGMLDVSLRNFRDYAEDKRGTVDDRPHGGGPGMVMMCGPVYAAVEAARAREGFAKARTLLMSPQGLPLTQDRAAALAQEEAMILVCGRYEGFDERILTGLGAEEVSIGDYVLSGGELPAMVIVDAVMRLLPGVLGDPRSAAQDSFTSGGLDFPQYTRPREFRGMAVPEILLSGDHEKIEQWRQEQARVRTEARRRRLALERRV